MKGWRSILAEERGVTLIEMVVVILVIVVLVTIAMLNADFIKSHRLSSGVRILFSDLQKTRQDAMTRGSANSRGYGLVFDSGSAYTLFEFNDVNANYAYDGAGEQTAANTHTLSNSVTVTRSDNSAPTGDVLIYDKRGLVRNNAWTTVTDRVYLLNIPGISQIRCIQIGATQIREGTWNGTSCTVM